MFCRSLTALRPPIVCLAPRRSLHLPVRALSAAAEMAKKQALLVIDMQNDFVHPKGVLPVKGAMACLPRVQEAVAAARAYSVPVIWVVREHHASGGWLQGAGRRSRAQCTWVPGARGRLRRVGSCGYTPAQATDQAALVCFGCRLRHRGGEGAAVQGWQSWHPGARHLG